MAHMPTIENGKFILPAWAMILMTLLLPFMGDFVKSQFRQTTSSSSVETKVTNLETEVHDLRVDVVHRSEFSSIQGQVQNSVTKDEFAEFEKMEEERHSAEMQRLDAITDSLMVGRRSSLVGK